MTKTETNTILIHRPITEVFAFVADPENLPKWASRTYDITKTSEATLGVGTRFMGVGRFLGQRLESHQEVIEYEPSWKYATRSNSGPLTFILRYSFEPVEGNTRIVFTAEVEPGGFLKVAEAIFAKAIKRLYENDLRRLKDLLEAQPLSHGVDSAPGRVLAHAEVIKQPHSPAP